MQGVKRRAFLRTLVSSYQGGRAGARAQTHTHARARARPCTDAYAYSPTRGRRRAEQNGPHQRSLLAVSHGEGEGLNAMPKANYDYAATTNDNYAVADKTAVSTQSTGSVGYCRVPWSTHSRGL